MTRVFWVKVGIAAVFGIAGGAAVDLRMYLQREDQTLPFKWRVAIERWLVAGLAAGLAAAGLSGVGGALPPPVLE